MKNEFSVKKFKDATVYTIESASGGGTSSGSVASVSKPLGKDQIVVQSRMGQPEAPKPRNFVAKNAKMGGAGQHKDKKKAEKQGDVKHKKPFAEQGVAEGEKTMSRAAKGHEKYGKDGMKALAKAGREGASEKKLDAIRDKHDHYNEEWSQKYKSSINCSHPKGFSQKAHCAGKKKHEESMMTMEAVCPDCGMCETHGDNMMEVKQRLDAKCWKGYRKAGTKMKGGVRVNNCVPVSEGAEDHEIQMAGSELQSIAKNAVHLLDLVRKYSEQEGLQAWQQSKITKAADYLNSVLQSVSGEQSALGEVSLGDYRKKAGMQKAQAGMNAMFARSPEEREKNLATFNKREKGLNRVKDRDNKNRADAQAKNLADLVARLPELKSQYEEMRAEYKALGGSDWQYADREQNLTDREREARNMEGPMNNLWRQIQAAEKAQGEQGVGEAAPAVVSGAAGLALGGLAAAGTPALMGIFGPVLGIGIGATGAYNAAKMGMSAADDLWDWAAKKLGGDNSASEFAKAHMRAAAKGEDSFEFNGSTFKTSLQPTQVPAAAKAVKQVSESKKRAVELSASLNEFYETAVMEKIPANAPVDVWIQDFEKSTAPQFRGKNKAKRKQMAIAASYSAKNPKKKK